MDSTMLLLPGLAIIATAGYLVHRRRRPDGLVAYFEAAVRVALWRDDPAGTLAALAAAKVAGPRQRARMMARLAQLSGQLQRLSQRASRADEVQARLANLAARLGDEAWVKADAAAAEAALGEVDPVLLAGLRRGDPAELRRRHPRLFEAASLLDLVALDRPDPRSPVHRLFGPFG